LNLSGGNLLTDQTDAQQQEHLRLSRWGFDEGFAGPFAQLIDDFQNHPCFGFRRNSPDKIPHGLSGAALLSDNFANVTLGDMQFQDNRVCAFKGLDEYILRAIHERFCNLGDEGIDLGGCAVHLSAPLSMGSLHSPNGSLSGYPEYLFKMILSQRFQLLV
jgi:hypothetical protein